MTTDLPEVPFTRSFRTNTKPFQYIDSLMADSDRTVLQRSEPSSCSALMSEQLNR